VEEYKPFNKTKTNTGSVNTSCSTYDSRRVTVIQHNRGLIRMRLSHHVQPQMYQTETFLLLTWFLANKEKFTPPITHTIPFIEVPVPSQERDVYMCLRYRFCLWFTINRFDFWNCSNSGILFFLHFIVCLHLPVNTNGSGRIMWLCWCDGVCCLRRSH
jgi:hypothetical protein